jgi:hypothetical protein
MPRNVVTVVPRRWPVLRRVADRRDRQDRLFSGLAERYRLRPRPAGDGYEIDFPKSPGRRAAKEEVIAALERIDRNWRRLVDVYPLDRNLPRVRP